MFLCLRVSMCERDFKGLGVYTCFLMIGESPQDNISHIFVNIFSPVQEVHAYKHQHEQVKVHNTDIVTAHAYFYFAEVSAT